MTKPAIRSGIRDILRDHLGPDADPIITELEGDDTEDSLMEALVLAALVSIRDESLAHPDRAEHQNEEAGWRNFVKGFSDIVDASESASEITASYLQIS